VKLNDGVFYCKDWNKNIHFIGYTYRLIFESWLEPLDTFYNISVLNKHTVSYVS